jgi:hypothetical protein
VDHHRVADLDRGDDALGQPAPAVDPHPQAVAVGPAVFFLSQRRAVEATLKFATSAFVRSTRRYSGVLSAFPYDGHVRVVHLRSLFVDWHRMESTRRPPWTAGGSGANGVGWIWGQRGWLWTGLR